MVSRDPQNSKNQKIKFTVINCPQDVNVKIFDAAVLPFLYLISCPKLHVIVVWF